MFGDSTFRTTIEEGDFSDVWSQAVQRDFPSWSVGVNVTLPIFLREGRGERDRLRGELDAAEERLIATQRDVEDRVRANHRELANGARRLEVAREGVAASLEEIRIALIEYQNGQTTAFEVVRVGADLPRAQQRYSAALVRTARAAAELTRLTSDTLAESESTD
jgi:outer membrane protein TolC